MQVSRLSRSLHINKSPWKAHRQMQTIEMYFNAAIARYRLFEQTTLLLKQDIPSLTPDDIQLRSTELAVMQKELTENKNHLFDLIEFIGPGVLDTSFIGEFQRALEKSIHACDDLYAEILTYRAGLTLHCSQKISIANP